MEALQYIYTSWKNGDSPEKGYMIYSRSEGISDSECNAIKLAMQYLAPKELTPAPTQEEITNVFPYAFAYFVLPTGRGCVAQSTYLGKDYSGRFGNYIIYALVFDIQDLPCRPAEFFAEDYIKTSMTEEELNASSPVPPLPALKISDYANVINDDQIGEFLFDKEEEFAQLITMILAANDAGIPFYLNDHRENLVLWSAAVQRVLPPKVANGFMFNTYVGDHESMRSQKAKDEGLHFSIIGVRPDANFFNYATECKSNRHIVMDFLGGHMTQGLTPGSYAQMMAQRSTFDFDWIDSFGEFVDSTAYRAINGELQDAYIYYMLLKEDEFELSENNLKAILSFGDKYCSESDNADVGSKLLMRYQEERWEVTTELFASFWKYICKHSEFMIYTLYELFDELIYQYAGEAAEPCKNLESLLETIENATPHNYKAYLEYLNSSNSVEGMLLYLSGHTNLFTNEFYIAWILRSYLFQNGLYNNQPITKLLIRLLQNITFVEESEKQMLDILITTSENRILFENILSIFMSRRMEAGKQEKLCKKYIEIADSYTESQSKCFEKLLMDIQEAAPLATCLYAWKISSAKDSEKEFWSFYDSNRYRIVHNSGLKIDTMILACIKNVPQKNREDVAIDILKKIDNTLINDSETIVALTDIVNDCSIKYLSKLDVKFMESVCRMRERVEKAGLDKIKAVCFGEQLIIINEQHTRPMRFSEELETAGITLSTVDKADYGTYIKNYFDDYLVLIKDTKDISVFMNAFYHEHYFSSFVDEYISAVKKMEKKESERWKRILGWTCVYIINAENSNKAATELFKPLIRYMRSLNDMKLVEIRQVIIRSVPIEDCDSLFDEIRRKEGLSERISSLFHKKQQ